MALVPLKGLEIILLHMGMNTIRGRPLATLTIILNEDLARLKNIALILKKKVLDKASTNSRNINQHRHQQSTIREEAHAAPSKD